MAFLKSDVGAKPQNPECLAKAFDAHADEVDKKITREALTDVPRAFIRSGLLLRWEETLLAGFHDQFGSVECAKSSLFRK